MAEQELICMVEPRYVNEFCIEKKICANLYRISNCLNKFQVIRSCSVEALEFTQAMQNNEISLAIKQNALKNAIIGHNTYAKEAVNGFGVDRHLQGLKMAAADLGVPIPKLFSDPGYTRSSRMRLSTSQIRYGFT